MYEFTITRHRRAGYLSPRYIRSAMDAYRIFRKHFSEADREHFVVLLLDSHGRPMGFYVAAIGSLEAVSAHPREVFKPALLADARAIIVLHNHLCDSCEPRPSPEDRATTRRLTKAGRILDVHVIDHLVVGDGRFYSFSDKRMHKAPPS